MHWVDVDGMTLSHDGCPSQERVEAVTDNGPDVETQNTGNCIHEYRRNKKVTRKNNITSRILRTNPHSIPTLVIAVNGHISTYSLALSEASLICFAASSIPFWIPSSVPLSTSVKFWALARISFTSCSAVEFPLTWMTSAAATTSLIPSSTQLICEVTGPSVLENSVCEKGGDAQSRNER